MNCQLKNSTFLTSAYSAGRKTAGEQVSEEEVRQRYAQVLDEMQTASDNSGTDLYCYPV